MASANTAIAPLSLSGPPAFGPTLGRVGVALGSVEFLFLGCERERSAAIRTLNGLVLTGQWMTSLMNPSGTPGHPTLTKKRNQSTNNLNSTQGHDTANRTRPANPEVNIRPLLHSCPADAAVKTAVKKWAA